MPIGYRMDRLSGKMIGANSRSAYSPKAFQPVEPVPAMKMSANERAAPVRSMTDMKTPMSQTKIIPQTEVLGKFPDTPGFRKLQQWQRFFSTPDGKLVWEKLPRDRAMYKGTVALCAVGMLMFTSTMYKMAYGIKP